MNLYRGGGLQLKHAEATWTNANRLSICLNTDRRTQF